MYVLGYLILPIVYLQYQCHTVSSKRQMTLTDKHLQMGARPYPPYLVKKKESYSGLLWNLVEFIQKARNCTFTVVIPPDGKWGKCFGHDNCTGMLGMVSRKEVDFAIGTKKSISRLVISN